ncbi:phenylalanine--tRNA ligase subunit beta [Bacillus fonticola]|uniref:phenylalanine--tRNA ligase subunit beta n=1 Tax=Bacillus fonticola TaxID=2728853 RepID=UPI001472B232|nr:phenylalanine--tRNA ligase subunit beta [Bacillus fonticola]
MLVSLEWLQQYVDLSGLTPEELAEKVTRTGIEVEGVRHLDDGVKEVVVGYVQACEPHPNADHLNKCTVDIGGTEPVQIICGAPNVAQGQRVAVAKVGAKLPGGVKIKRAKLRGEVSEGMICSLQELGVDGKVVPKDVEEGIYVFPESAQIGEDALAILGLRDTVIELGLTPNRSDCLSMMGVAYEVGAIVNRSIDLPTPTQTDVATGEFAGKHITVTVDATEDNPLYVAKLVRNVTIGPSPLWLQNRLRAAGIRPHNNIVDITNYVLLEYGQPLHAFDYDRFGSKQILVRRANDGEEIVTLDDEKRTLTGEHLVITNGTEPVAVAGVMGGANSEVTAETTTVLLESALFAGGPIRAASKALGLRSEASSRFEKGVDPNRVEEAAERAAQLMVELAGGEVLEGSVIEDHRTDEPRVITVPADKVNRVLGTEISPSDMVALLERLQLPTEASEGTLTVKAPTRRGDLVIEEDVIEEIGRLYGYDNFSYTLPRGEATPGGLTPYQKKRRLVKRAMEEAGLTEAITYSLTSEKLATAFALQQAETTKLSLPMSEERKVLRQSLLPGLLEVAQYNIARSQHNVALYEIGRVFLQEKAGQLPTETERLAVLITGKWTSHDWQAEVKETDFYVAKGLVTHVFAQLGISREVRFEQGKVEGFHPGRTAQILLGSEVIGTIGQLHPSEEAARDLKATYVAEVDLETLLNADLSSLGYEPIPRYPAVTRDVALVVDESVSAGTLRTIIEKTGGKLLEAVYLFDLYDGEHMEKGKKSIAFSLTYLNRDRTLTDEEVTKAHEAIVSAVKEQTDATVRGA